MNNKKIRCTTEENDYCTSLMYQGANLPERITYIYLDGNNEYIFYKETVDQVVIPHTNEKDERDLVEYNEDVSVIIDTDKNKSYKETGTKSCDIKKSKNNEKNTLDNEIQIINSKLAKINNETIKQTKELIVIKKCMIFFVVLTIIGLIFAAIVFIYMLCLLNDLLEKTNQIKLMF